MEVDKKRRNTKYAGLTDEERKKKYNEASREWYTRQTPEEKKAIIKKNVQRKHGICEVCKNGRMYANIQEHEHTKAHLKKLETLESV